MSLRFRLVVVNLGLIGLFLVSFFITLRVVGGPSMLHPGSDGLLRSVSQQVSRVYRQQGRDGLLVALDSSLFPIAAAEIYDARGVRVHRRGRQLPTALDRVKLCLAGQESSQGRPPELQLFCRLEGGQGVVRLLLQPDSFQPAGASRAVLIGLLVATTLCAVVGLLLSQAISKPLRRLNQAVQAVSKQNYDCRVEAGGGGELADMADSFNRMAQHLQETIVGLTQAKEAAERSEARRRQFMADVSHNLKTPMAAIVGWSDALLDGLPQVDSEAHLSNIRDQVLYLAQNVQRLTDWCRWEDRPPELEWEHFPLSEPLLETLAVLEESALRKEMVLVVSGLEHQPRVRADRLRVRELFQLLLENAIQHNPPATRLEVLLAATDPEKVEVVVADNGVGLPAALADDLESRPGGGLGLAIACRLVRAHGGELRLEAGRPGTRLRFSLARSCDPGVRQTGEVLA